MNGQREALVVANSVYADAALRRLVAPAQDAKDLAEVLGDPAIGDFQVRSLIDRPSYEVRAVIEEFLTGRKRDDLLLLYFSGHGIKDEEGRLYFATHDTQLVHQRLRRATAVEATFIHESMQRCSSRRQVLLLDCCYSGAFSQSMTAKSGGGVDTSERFSGRGRVVLTASDAMQYSFEGAAIEGEGVRSLFTQILVAGLRSGEADLDRDGLFSVDEIYDYVHDHLVDEETQQRPTKISQVEGRIFLGKNPRAHKAELARELSEALRSGWVSTRLGAAQELARLLEGNVPAMRDAARRALTALLEDDSREVSRAAAAALGRQERPAAASPPSPPEALPEPPRAPTASQDVQPVVVAEGAPPADSIPPPVPEASPPRPSREAEPAPEPEPPAPPARSSGQPSVERRPPRALPGVATRFGRSILLVLAALGLAVVVWVYLAPRHAVERAAVPASAGPATGEALSSQPGVPAAAKPPGEADGTPVAPATVAPSASQRSVPRPAAGTDIQRLPGDSKVTIAQLPPVLALVNGQEIRKAELLQEVALLKSQPGGASAGDTSTLAFYRQALDALIGSRLALAEADAQGFHATDAEVKTHLDQVRSRFSSPEEFKKTLAAVGMTAASFASQIRQQVRLQKYAEAKVTANLPPISDAAVRSFYEKNLDQLKQPEKRRVSHILVKADPNASSADRAAAKAKADDILAQLLKGGDFAALAKEHSDDPATKGNGGDLSWIEKGQTVPTFEAAAWALKAKNDLSPVVESPFGFHIIRLLDVQDARTLPYKEVKPRIAEYLKQQQIQERVKAKIQELRSRAKVETFL